MRGFIGSKGNLASSKYAAIQQCGWEVDAAEKLFRRETIPTVSSTHTSIEEIASKILQALGLNRQLCHPIGRSFVLAKRISNEFGARH